MSRDLSCRGEPSSRRQYVPLTSCLQWVTTWLLHNFMQQGIDGAIPVDLAREFSRAYNVLTRFSPLGKVSLINLRMKVYLGVGGVMQVLPRKWKHRSLVLAFFGQIASLDVCVLSMSSLVCMYLYRAF